MAHVTRCRFIFKKSSMTMKTPLTLQEQQAMVAALDDEYKSHET